MSTTLGHLRRHFNDALLTRSGRVHALTAFAKSLMVPLNRMLARAHEFAALRPDNTQLDIKREITIVASAYAIRSCVDEATRNMLKVSPNLRFDISPLSKRSPTLLENSEVDLVFSGQSLDVGVPPSTSLLEDKFVFIACLEMGPTDLVLLPQDFSEREHAVVQYFDKQMTFEDEDALRKEGVIRNRRITTWPHTHVAS